MARIHRDGTLDDEELVREGGVFVSRNGGHEVGPQDTDHVATDWVEDPEADDGVPGTRDDLPYDYGVDLSPPADQLLLDLDK
jgi:hypothetical protein